VRLIKSNFGADADAIIRRSLVGRRLVNARQRRLRKSPTDNGGATHKERGRTGASRSQVRDPPDAHMLRLRLHFFVLLRELAVCPPPDPAKEKAPPLSGGQVTWPPKRRRRKVGRSCRDAKPLIEGRVLSDPADYPLQKSRGLTWLGDEAAFWRPCLCSPFWWRSPLRAERM
jgi:hypothetical protein